MTKGGNLWAIGYDDMGRAEQVRAEITRLGERHCLNLLETAVVVCCPDGSVTLDGEPFVVVPKVEGRTCASFFAGCGNERPVGRYRAWPGSGETSRGNIVDWRHQRQILGGGRQ
jgi:hypothetical protein